MVKQTSTTTKKKGGRGTHGSLTKAGKVRMQTPQIQKTMGLEPSKAPRMSNRRKYEKRVLLKRESGQNDRQER